MKKSFSFSSGSTESDSFVVRGGRYMVAVSSPGSGVTLQTDVSGSWVDHDEFSEDGAWAMFLSSYHRYRFTGPDGATVEISRLDDRAAGEESV